MLHACAAVSPGDEKCGTGKKAAGGKNLFQHVGAHGKSLFSQKADDRCLQPRAGQALCLLTRNDEQIVSPDDLGLHTLKQQDLSGGDTVEEAARIFISVLENKSTRAQKEVALANAGMALYCADSSLGLRGAVEKARESLESGKALKSFKNLLDI